MVLARGTPLSEEMRQQTGSLLLVRASVSQPMLQLDVAELVDRAYLTEHAAPVGISEEVHR